MYDGAVFMYLSESGLLGSKLCVWGSSVGPHAYVCLDTSQVTTTVMDQRLDRPTLARSTSFYRF